MLDMFFDWRRWGSLLALLFLCCGLACAQDNYEIQVYGSDTVPEDNLMVELHSNFTVDGSKTVVDGVIPTNHAEHETLELTYGWNSWFETGFYVFTSINPGYGWQWVGDHIRPRVRVPESWHWPVGVSLSTEIGYQQAQFSPDTWTWEIRPIVDKQYKRWYFAFNPALERSLHGPGVNDGFAFSPNAKVSYEFVKWRSGNNPKNVAFGLEYYGSFGPIPDFSPYPQQQQQFFPAIDLDVSPKWEINFGVGIGTTQSTDHLIVKSIIGRRFSFRRDRASAQ